MIEPGFKGSDAKIAIMLVGAKFTGKPLEQSDAVVNDVLKRFAINGYTDGAQIGTEHMLYDVVDTAINNLQMINRSLAQVDPPSDAELKAQEQDLAEQRAKMLAALEKATKISDEEKKEILRRLLSAPNKQEYKDYIDKFTNPIQKIEERSMALSKEAEQLFTAIRQTQQKNLDRYRRLFNTADGDKQKTLPEPTKVSEYLTPIEETKQQRNR